MIMKNTAKTVRFESDKVTVKTGRVDNSAIVSFEIGEYQLDQIKDLVSVRDSVLKVTVEIEKQ